MKTKEQIQNEMNKSGENIKVLEKQLKELTMKLSDSELVTKEAIRTERLQMNRLRYQKEALEIQEFRTKIETELDILNHPKKDILFEIAWEHGHSCGFSEVENWYHNLFRLIQ